MFYINATTFGRIQIRLGDLISDEVCEGIKQSVGEVIPEDNVISFGGHDRAFTLHHNGSYDHDQIMQHIEKIYMVLERRLND
jgi:hypothetical protein